MKTTITAGHTSWDVEVARRASGELMLLPFMKRNKHDPEGEILTMGWDTESTSENRMRAIRGSTMNPASDTGWKANWDEVLGEVRRQTQQPNAPHEQRGANDPKV